MIVVPDSSRKMISSDIALISKNVDDLYADVIAIKRENCPNYTDESTSDFGNHLLYAFSVLSKYMVDHIERTANDNFIFTTKSRQSLRGLCRLINYQLSEAAPASVIVTFTLESGHPEFTILQGTKVAAQTKDNLNSVVFETTSDQIVSVGVNTIDIVCIQGETITNEIIGSSDGSSQQVKVLNYRNVIWESEQVEVYDGVWTQWTRVDDFVSSMSSDKHYVINADEYGNYYIIFGTGDNGHIPVRGNNNIRVSYRIGGGIDGNVTENVINELITIQNYITAVNNSQAASGGADKEPMAHAKLFAPASKKTLKRGVSIPDIETLVNTYVSSLHGGISASKAYILGGLNINVMIVPQYGSLPSDELKTEIQNYLDVKKMSCTSIRVIDPVYENVDIDVSIDLYPNFESSVVVAEVRQRLLNYLSPIYQDPITGLYPHGFGRDIYLSDIYSIVDGTVGVNFCAVNNPTSNIIIPEYKIGDVGGITITVNSNTGQQSYVDLKNERINKNIS